MFHRRTLLRALFSIGGFTVLLAAFKHRSPYAEEDKSKGAKGRGGGNGGGY